MNSQNFSKMTGTLFLLMLMGFGQWATNVEAALSPESQTNVEITRILNSPEVLDKLGIEYKETSTGKGYYDIVEGNLVHMTVQVNNQSFAVQPRYTVIAKYSGAVSCFLNVGIQYKPVLGRDGGTPFDLVIDQTPKCTGLMR